MESLIYTNVDQSGHWISLLWLGFSCIKYNIAIDTVKDNQSQNYYRFNKA